ncbi:MAG: Mut7-C RNAse domain-containing protein [Anaerolineales bacterium]|nr:Mut7-C ubiquitin/RNAse domain-containing protein [Anaerolineales bacterium]
MTRAKIHFQEPLNELLYSRNRESLQVIDFNENQTIKHLIESSGIPHTEVGQLIANDQLIDFNYLVNDDDYVIVYPATSKHDQLSGMLMNGEMTIPVRFILDNHLGKLASHLRMLGFDADYSNEYQDKELAESAVSLGRILLTRDRQLLMHKTIRFGYLIRSLQPEIQILEILDRFNLSSEITFFQRCLRCNHPLEPVEKSLVELQLQPLTKKYFQDFNRCTGCRQVYWRGSHVERMEKWLRDILPPKIISNLEARQLTSPNKNQP